VAAVADPVAVVPPLLKGTTIVALLLTIIIRSGRLEEVAAAAAELVKFGKGFLNMASFCFFARERLN
jgi:hypothetical protein